MASPRALHRAVRQRHRLLHRGPFREHIGHRSRWCHPRRLTFARRARRILWTLLLAGGVSCFLAVAGVSLLWWLAAALMVLSALVFFPRGRLIWATRMEHGYVWIAGVHPDYLALLPEWPR